PESNVTAAKFLNTSATLTALNPGQLTSVDHLFMVDPELAVVYGPASLMAEYFYVPITQTQHDPLLNSGAAACRITSAAAAAFSRCPDVALTGWYAELAYFLTGESRPYNAATARWDRLKPNHNLGKDGFGAIELAARISHADFDDGPDFQKGTETNYTVGLNWYVNPYIRFMMDYVWVRNNASALGNAANLLSGKTAGYDDPQIMEFRAQVDW
ncbi:MAG TPA: porin, partial [Alphaproteobacteria bacterium]|nr:porin [Alphaproteobacteria bacterium]